MWREHRRSWRLLGGLGAALALSACQVIPSLGPGPVPLGLAVDPSASRAERVSTGGLTLSIRWPARTVQYLPVSAVAIDLKVMPLGSNTPLATKTTLPPAGGGTSTVTFQGLPSGPIVVSASARDAAGKVVSAGSTRIDIVPNALASGRLVLNSTETPMVLTMSATNGDPGMSVTMFGSGFGAAADATYSVRLGGVEVPASDLQRDDDTTLSFKVPAAATTSVVTLQVGVNATQSTEVFTTIRSWTISPTSADVFYPQGVATFSALAKDWAGETVTSPSTRWATTTLSGAPGSIDPKGSFTAGELAGSHKVRLGSGPLAVEASVATHEMTLADFGDKLGVRGPIVHPVDNPTSPEKVALGKTLFFDEGLGSSGKMSCATCHMPNLGWGDALPRSLGNNGVNFLPRNANTVLDVAYLKGPFFWNGRANSLENQVIWVFNTPLGHNRSEAAVTEYLTSANYQASFSAVFGSPDLTRDRTAQAIAAFERTVVTGDSAYDRWAKGDANAMTLAEKRGLAVFATAGRCIDCHFGPMFTDEKFHNISIFEADGSLDPGRKAITGKNEDLGAFRTPTLRNVSETGPYFHNGSTKTLSESILRYESNVTTTPNLDPLVAEPIVISAAQRNDLEAFLRALTGTLPSVTP